jgi:hypothetical protein
LAEAAVGSEGEAFRGRELEAGADAVGDVLGAFDVVVFDVDDTDGDVFSLGDFADDFELGEFAAGHFEVDFVGVEFEETWKHGGVAAESDGAAFVIAEAEVCGETTAADCGFDGAIKDVDETGRIFEVRVTAHGRFVDGDFAAAGFSEGIELGADDGQECFGEGVAVGVLRIGHEATAECVGAWDAGLEGGSGIGVGAVGEGGGGLGESGEASVGEALEALEICDGAEATRGAECGGDAMAAALVVGWGAEAAGGSGFKFDAFEETVEREVKIEAGLFAVCDDVEAGIDLVVDGDDDGIVDELLAVCVTEVGEVGGGEFEPGGEGVAADDRRAEWLGLHRLGDIYQREDGWSNCWTVWRDSSSVAGEGCGAGRR